MTYDAASPCNRAAMGKEMPQEMITWYPWIHKHFGESICDPKKAQTQLRYQRNMMLLVISSFFCILVQKEQRFEQPKSDLYIYIYIYILYIIYIIYYIYIAGSTFNPWLAREIHMMPAQIPNLWLVVDLPLWKYESQWEGLSHIWNGK